MGFYKAIAVNGSVGDVSKIYAACSKCNSFDSYQGSGAGAIVVLLLAMGEAKQINKVKDKLSSFFVRSVKVLRCRALRGIVTRANFEKYKSSSKSPQSYVSVKMENKIEPVRINMKELSYNELINVLSTAINTGDHSCGAYEFLQKESVGYDTLTLVKPSRKKRKHWSREEDLKVGMLSDGLCINLNTVFF